MVREIDIMVNFSNVIIEFEEPGVYIYELTLDIVDYLQVKMPQGIIYPQGCRPIQEELGADELIRRLKVITQYNEKFFISLGFNIYVNNECAYRQLKN